MFPSPKVEFEILWQPAPLPLDVTRIGHVQISPSRLHATDPHRKINLMDLRIGIRLDLAAPQQAERTELDNAPAYRISPI